MKKSFQIVIPLTLFTFVAVVIFIVFRVYFLSTNFKEMEIVGDSMSPTLLARQKLLISKKFTTVKRGDLILYAAPPNANCPEKTGCEFIKRVIGVPGERISIKNNNVLINGEILPEPYLAPSISTLGGPVFQGKEEIILDNDEYFILGDNRPYSSDSRAWGPLKKVYIKGVVSKKL